MKRRVKPAKQSFSVLRLDTNEPEEIAGVGRTLSRQKGVSRVSFDHASHVVSVEYDSDEVSFETIREIVSGASANSRREETKSE